MRRVVFLKLLAIGMAIHSADIVLAECVVSLPSFQLHARVVYNSTPMTATFSIPFPQYGSIVAYQQFDYPNGPCDSGQVNCHNESYTWLEFNIDDSFQIPWRPTGGNFDIMITKDEVEAYFDWIYAGWEKLGPMDWTVNCHGFTFGKSHWVQGDETGVDILLGSLADPCYPSTGQMPLAKYAVRHDLSHSAKVIGVMCTIPYGGGYMVVMPTMTQRVEKDGPGPVYRKTVTCSTSGGVQGVLAMAPHQGGWWLYKDL